MRFAKLRWTEGQLGTPFVMLTPLAATCAHKSSIQRVSRQVSKSVPTVLASRVGWRWSLSPALAIAHTRRHARPHCTLDTGHKTRARSSTRTPLEPPKIKRAILSRSTVCFQHRRAYRTCPSTMFTINCDGWPDICM
jgi:hypothetical protein